MEDATQTLTEDADVVVVLEVVVCVRNGENVSVKDDLSPTSEEFYK
jgi:hypothetical protein